MACSLSDMKLLRFGAVVMLLSLLLCSCKVSDDITQTDIEGEYIFCVEEATGDQHNVRIIYSLKRTDGGDIAPDAHFKSLMTEEPDRSASSKIEYQISDDGKIIWITEEQSSAKEYDSETLYTVKMEDLVFGDESDHETIEGSWEASYKMQIEKEHIEILDEMQKIQFPEGESYYFELSSIQLSSRGMHVEMIVPDYDITKLSENFSCILIFEDGTEIELTEMRHSIRSRNWSNRYNAYCEKLFEEQINLDNVYAVNVCGTEIQVKK